MAGERRLACRLLCSSGIAVLILGGSESIQVTLGGDAVQATVKCSYEMEDMYNEGVSKVVWSTDADIEREGEMG